MNIFKEESGLAAIVIVVLLIGLLGVSGIGYQVNRSKHRANIKPPVSVSPSPTTQTNPSTSSMGIDYPVDQGLKGKVFCNEKVDPEPCAAKIDIKPVSSDASVGSPGPVKTIETDAQGNFSVELVAGSYTITPAPKKEYPIFVPPLPNPVVVKQGQVTEITVTYHSGLR